MSEPIRHVLGIPELHAILEREFPQAAAFGEVIAVGEGELQLRLRDGDDDRHLRLVAEFNNFRRRSEQERLSAWSRAQADLVKRFIDMLDDLQRVADGSFGLCVDCGVSIGNARLHASPTAMRCVACQEKREQAQGSTHTATH